MKRSEMFRERNEWPSTAGDSRGAEWLHGVMRNPCAGKTNLNNLFQLSVTDKTFSDEIRNALDSLLEKAASHQFTEIWIDRDAFPTICALMNGEVGWLMYMRYEGDAGFSSRNPNYAGSEDELIDYYLQNGQHDRYPASWAYPREIVFSALRAFAEAKQLNRMISWHNDSEDGSASPEDAFVEPRTDFA